MILIVLGIFATVGRSGPVGDAPITFDQAKSGFEMHRLKFEEIVEKLKSCPAIEEIHSAGKRLTWPASTLFPPTELPQQCREGDRQTPLAISRSLSKLGVLAVRPTWSKKSTDCDCLAYVRFTLRSNWVPDFSVSIDYFDEPLSATAIANNWLPLTDTPSHWSYHLSKK